MRKLIVGLGNPGVKFMGTRHNTGFLVVEKLADVLGGRGSWESRVELESEIFNFRPASRRYKLAFLDLILAKPRIGMNSSGEAVKKIVDQGELEFDNLLLVHDDLDLPLGEFRLRKGRGAAGHRGVESVINTLSSRDFWRLRVGIGRPPEGVASEDYVLGKFTFDERRLIDELIEEELVEIVKDWSGR